MWREREELGDDGARWREMARDGARWREMAGDGHLRRESEELVDAAQHAAHRVDREGELLRHSAPHLRGEIAGDASERGATAAPGRVGCAVRVVAAGRAPPCVCVCVRMRVRVRVALRPPPPPPPHSNTPPCTLSVSSESVATRADGRVSLTKLSSCAEVARRKWRWRRGWRGGEHGAWLRASVGGGAAERAAAPARARSGRGRA